MPPIPLLFRPSPSPPPPIVTLPYSFAPLTLPSPHYSTPKPPINI